MQATANDDVPGQHAVVLRADAGCVRPVCPVQQNFLFRSSTVKCHLRFERHFLSEDLPYISSLLSFWSPVHSALVPCYSSDISNLPNIAIASPAHYRTQWCNYSVLELLNYTRREHDFWTLIDIKNYQSRQSLVAVPVSHICVFVIVECVSISIVIEISRIPWAVSLVMLTFDCVTAWSGGQDLLKTWLLYPWCRYRHRLLRLAGML